MYINVTTSMKNILEWWQWAFEHLAYPSGMSPYDLDLFPKIREPQQGKPI
jgi:hypothetical protein